MMTELRGEPTFGSSRPQVDRPGNNEDNSVRRGRSPSERVLLAALQSVLCSASKVELCRDLHNALFPGRAVLAEIGSQRFRRSRRPKVIRND